ncbi:MAG: 2-phospho-L-lactate transferase [Thermomicrobiales bacterium]|nr:2-phospho-L-lactate transferase [Thermomicrobiales bacterium]
MNIDKIQIAALAGGVGGARMLDGFAALGMGDRLTAIVNTADDFSLWGLPISPDIDTVMYTLAGLANVHQGWGIAGDTRVTLDAIARYGEDPWFLLGDQDFATHILRGHRLAQGLSLSEVTAQLVISLGVQTRILPMTNDLVHTHIRTEDGWMDFQSYFVGRRHADHALEVRFDGIEDAESAPGVSEALIGADLILFCPSNPIVSVDPILSVAGVRKTISASTARKVCVSPIIGGQAVKGPAADMLHQAGYEVSALGVARWYGELVDVMVIDEKDAALADDIRALGHEVIVLQTLMGDRDDRARLATEILAAL